MTFLRGGNTITRRALADPKFDLKTCYAAARTPGFILYPGKLTTMETFRVGYIGAPLLGDVGYRASRTQISGFRPILPGAPLRNAPGACRWPVWQSCSATSQMNSWPRIKCSHINSSNPYPKTTA